MVKPQASRAYTASCSAVTALVWRIRTSRSRDVRRAYKLLGHRVRPGYAHTSHHFPACIGCADKQPSHPSPLSDGDSEDDDEKSDGGKDDDGDSDGSSGYHVDNGAALHRSMAAL
ncbi:hypothetical protein Tco_1566982 [Tanacetum coccineum]